MNCKVDSNPETRRQCQSKSNQYWPQEDVDRMQWKNLRLLEDVRSEKIDIAHLPSAKVGSKINSIIIIAAGQIIIHAIQMQ